MREKVDRGLFVFIIVAVLSLATVWMLLTRPTQRRSLSEISEVLSANQRPPENPDTTFFSAPLEARILPSSKLSPAQGTAPEIEPPSPDLILALQSGVRPPSVPSSFPYQPGESDFPEELRKSEPLPTGDMQPVDRNPRRDQRPLADLGRVATNSNPTTEHFPKQHVVRDGETLQDIAQFYYGNRELWPIIYEANRQALASPELLPVGLSLTIPNASGR